ncbi:hypothetical protein V865_001420 [Kwoniella europaea PYCC6329]|uniref:Protein kinase domain-containing protein n=1 Tax=Kwoniella europaea PYCC6329 TaxID=1423913 RepID=A0AAX4KD65_9TREE
MNQRFGWPENTSPESIRIEHKMEILAAYAQLHKMKIHHGYIGPEVIRFNPRIGYPSIDSGIRLIDFTHSLVSFTYMDGLGQPELDENLDMT